MSRVAIMGTGYVGLCTGLVLAEHGHDVTFVDVRPDRLDAVLAGRAPFFEPGVDELLASVRDRISATSDVQGAVRASAFTFLCVGTPQAADGSIDLRQVREASESVGRALASAPRGHTIVVKSTVVPGTAEGLVQDAVARASGLKPDSDFHVVSNPEFLKEGTALQDARAPDRIIVGARTGAAAERLLGLYKSLDAPHLVVSPRTAEMVKYSANAFLAVKISFANEMANACERLGVDWYEVAQGIGLDARIGTQFLRAGAGFGGSCFPKDVAALARVVESAGAPSRLLAAVAAVNETQPLVLVALAREELGTLRGKRIALLGLSFKPDTDDVRETRALPLHRALVAEGANVVAFDPKANEAFQRLAPDAVVASTLDEAVRDADAVIIQTEWRDFRELPPSWLKARMRGDLVVDGRRTFARPLDLLAAGLRYRAIGLGRGSA